MISCMVLSCATADLVSDAVAGHREAIFDKGDAPTHRTTIQTGVRGNLSWPYHANVMKTFEMVSRRIESERPVH